MSLTDNKENIGSVEITDCEENENSKMVPVTESIRYRKRAQSAEKKVEELAEQLTQVKTQASEMAEQLINFQVEQELANKLATAGAVDLEIAVLIAKNKIKGQAQVDLDACVEQLRKEKQYLFADTGVVSTAKKTAGVKDKISNNQLIIEGAAKKAATTGNRVDLQEYLKLRRNFL